MILLQDVLVFVVNMMLCLGSFSSSFSILIQLTTSSIGHGCGHNLITIQGLACALTTKALMEQNLVQGTVVLFGTPAEESTSGKIDFVKKNILQSKVDCAMMLVSDKRSKRKEERKRERD